VRATMRCILAEIQSGEFAREWILENQAGRPVYNALKRQGKAELVEIVGKELRGMMPFIDKGALDIDE
jgi:ketol-acid reductoisomerase